MPTLTPEQEEEREALVYNYLEAHETAGADVAAAERALAKFDAMIEKQTKKD